MNYGQAFIIAKSGGKIARASWPIGSYVSYQDSNVQLQTPPTLLYTDDITTISYQSSDGDKQADDWNTVG
jgi:hypothetical protein